MPFLKKLFVLEIVCRFREIEMVTTLSNDNTRENKIKALLNSGAVRARYLGE